MVMLSGMLIIIIGIGMLFFYQKQVERRMKFEFDIHRRLAAKSGFSIVQHSGTGTYHYVVSDGRYQRPDIWVTVGEAEPIYKKEAREQVRQPQNWHTNVLADFFVEVESGVEKEYKFFTDSDLLENRSELVFKNSDDGNPLEVAWNNHPFGLRYDILVRNTLRSGSVDGQRPWVGYLYVGESNSWSHMMTSNATVALAVFGVDGTNALNERWVRAYEYTENSSGLLTDPPALTNKYQSLMMNDETELYLDGQNMAISSPDGFLTMTLPDVFSSVTNVVIGLGGFNRDVATNKTLTISEFVIRNPFKYEIKLSWTNNNRYFGAYGTNLDIRATVVDKTTFGNDYYIFDSFETVVE